MSTSPQPVCPQCGGPLTADSPGGLCPRCLMAMNMAPPTNLTGEEPASPAPFAQPPCPAELAPFFPSLEILECLGRGGMGVVYKARQKSLNRLVALKILPPERVKDAAFAQRFAVEAEALARLNHPNIVTIHDFGQADGLFYFVMEFVDGVTLRELLQAGRVAPREALAIVPQICDALQYAHDHGIVHRDIKPENILLDRQGRVKVADFGLAKLVGTGESAASGTTASSSATTQAGQVMGTPQYMAPEQREHPSDVDHRADIYSLGVVFYQMLTGELPGKTLEPPSNKVVIDVRLDEVVLRALEKKPELRYQHVSDVKTMVETIASTPSQTTGRTAPATSAAVPAKQALENSAAPARFSITAIVGALQAILCIYCVWAFRDTSRGSSMSLLAGACFTTTLGWVAVSQIRRSAGPILGFGLAVFDGLLFPLLALDALIFMAFAAVIYFIRGLPYTASLEVVYTITAFALGLLTLALTAWADFVIVRAVWRAVNKPVGAAASVSRDRLVIAPAHHNLLATFACGAALASGLFAAATWLTMPQPPQFFVWSILIAALAAVAMAIPAPRTPRRRWAMWFGVIQCGAWIFFAFFFPSFETGRRQPPVLGLGAGPEIESVVVSNDQAVVEQRDFHGEGMIITFGPMANRWTPGSLQFDHLFDVTIEWPWFRRRDANWVIKSRHGIYASYRLESPSGAMDGKIVFHPGTPAREADGSYVIGEFRPEAGVPSPIAVRLAKDDTNRDGSSPGINPMSKAPAPAAAVAPGTAPATDPASLLPQSAVDSARENLAIMTARFNAGGADRLAVLEAEQHLRWTQAMFAGDRKAAAIALRDGATQRLALMKEKVKAGMAGADELAAVEYELARAQASLSELEAVQRKAR